MGGPYHKIQIVSFASAKITLNNGISAYVKNIVRFYEYGSLAPL